MTSAGCRVCRHSGRFHVPLSLAIALRLLYIGLSVETAEELRILGEVFFGFFVELLPGLFVPDAKSFQGGSEHDVFFKLAYSRSIGGRRIRPCLSTVHSYALER